MHLSNGAALGTPQHWLLNFITYLYVSAGVVAFVPNDVDRNKDKMIKPFNIVVFLCL